LSSIFSKKLGIRIDYWTVKEVKVETPITKRLSKKQTGEQLIFANRP